MEKKELVLLSILGLIIAIWVVVGIAKSSYPYWPAIAGALTIPFLLAALFVDNLPFLENQKEPKEPKEPKDSK